ncbi:hypothetical protein, partial [Pseudomonas savastanoi]|uniref:hypothetical protein n=2 Tax=Pseudomonas savastanoi TaxID=29438 RepID=UPI001C4F02F6
MAISENFVIVLLRDLSNHNATRGHHIQQKAQRLAGLDHEWCRAGTAEHRAMKTGVYQACEPPRVS